MTDPFRYKVQDGREIVLPRFSQLKAGLVRRVRKLSDVDQMFTVLEEVADPATIDIVDDLTQEEFDEVVRAWSSGGGVTAGESSAS